MEWFLNEYQPHGRIADYGGTENVGSSIVRDALATGGQHDYNPLDYDNGVDLMKPIKGPKFDFGICMDLLEHVPNPFVVAGNIYSSLKPNAHLFVTSPLIWELHFYPKDYWRFTPSGLEALFPKMDIELLGIVRDPSPDEVCPRSRVVGVFHKVPKLDRPRVDESGSFFPKEYAVK